MKIRLITVGKPKLAYAVAGWQEYLGRLERLHTVRTIHLPDKHAYDATKFRETTIGTTVVALEIAGAQFSSAELAGFLQARELEAREVSFVIGGPDGIPPDFSRTANYRWSLGNLTLPHDLAMVVTLESLYRASTINAHLPYHR